MSAAADNPGVRFPPPLLFVGGLALAALLHRQWPFRILQTASGRTSAQVVSGDGGRGLMLVAAWLLVGGGFMWMAWGIMTFRRARTGIYPTHPATAIVDHGPYRYGRNPMYVGMSAVYWGVTLWLNTWWGVLLFPLVIMMLLRFVIAREERYLNDAFPGAYADYRARVPRWLGAPR